MDTALGPLAVFLFAGLASHSGEATSDCYVKIVPASNTLFLHKNDDVSIVCDASCFGRRDRGRVTWYGPGGNPVPRSHGGRMFQMIYNRNMFSRLFLFGAGEENSGTYTCSVGEGDDVKMASIFLDISDVFIGHGGWGQDSGRGRGDVSILVPTLPPLQPLRRRRAAARMTRDAERASGDDDNEAGMDDTGGHETTRQIGNTQNTHSPSLGTEKGTAGSNLDRIITPSQTRARNTQSPPRGTEAATAGTTPVFTSSQTHTRPQQYETDPPSTTTAGKSSPPTLTNRIPSTASFNPTSGDKSKNDGQHDCPCPVPTPAPSPAPTPAYDLQHYFGSQGVIYFVVTLAIALLLAYTLVLVLYHHHCSQQATGSSVERERKKAEKAEKKMKEKELKEQKEKERQERKEQEKEAKRLEKEAKKLEKEARKSEKEAMTKQKLESEAVALHRVEMTDIVDQPESSESKGGNPQDVTVDLDGSGEASEATSDVREVVASATEASGAARKGDEEEKDELAEAVMKLLAPGTTTAQVCHPPKEAGEEDGEKRDNNTNEASSGAAAVIPPAPPLPGDSGGQGLEEGKDGGEETDAQDKGSDEYSPDE